MLSKEYCWQGDVSHLFYGMSYAHYWIPYFDWNVEQQLKHSYFSLYFFPSVFKEYLKLLNRLYDITWFWSVYA
jgi:hypothetical protein